MFLGEWRYVRGEREALESAFTRRACLALYARFVPQKIAAIMQTANKGGTVK